MSSDDHEHGERVGRYRVEWAAPGHEWAWAAPGRRPVWRWYGSYDKPESAQEALREAFTSGVHGRITAVVVIEEALQ